MNKVTDSDAKDASVNRELLSSNRNTGHGHVFPRPDGVRMRCGGPGLCDECSRDLARKQQGDRLSKTAFEPLRLVFPDGSVQILYMAGQVDPEIARLQSALAETQRALVETHGLLDDALEDYELHGLHMDCTYKEAKAGYRKHKPLVDAARAALKEPT